MLGDIDSQGGPVWFRRRDKRRIKESKEALADANKSLREVQKRSDEVSYVANALKEIRERNHFAEQLEEIMVRRRGMTR